MNLLLVNLNTVVAVLCVLMALHLFLQKSSNLLAVRLLGACFMVLGIHALLLGFNLTYSSNVLIAALQPTMPVLFGPLAYLMFQSAFQINWRLKRSSLLHLVPAALVLVLMLSEQGRSVADFSILLSLMGYALLLSHLSWCKKATFQTEPENTESVTQGFNKTIYLWLLIFTAYSWLVLIFDVLIVLEIITGKTTFQSIALMMTILFKVIIISFAIFLALQKSPLFDWLYTSFSTSIGKNIESKNLQVFQTIICAFEQLIEDATIYTKEVVSLKAMADKLGVSDRLFSNAINHHYGESYTKRINRLRVNFARRLLVEQPQLSIMAVMFDSGFQTKSSFNKEFKALTSLSPSEYREKQIKERQ
ncbi:helix-turn-helix domain-containing protein [Pseudoalteromonas sp. BSi20429]|uniref:AraC family transcriptional regulator n=1 Tax=Pseudoalteromonas sp. BSi20429 TaxID=1097676 RepID=UPI0002319854|nr:helix-turn-helix domain-containing protein [Pseudoalteromonas sp. BSi20429]GAA68907.1 hypothetical protein P20429_3037 [Pseudoalteromonas sp. BSi20429]